MRDNNKDFAISGYSDETEVVSGITSFVPGIIENIKSFAIRIQDQQTEAKMHLNRKRGMPNQIHQEPIKRMPLEQLIRMGFYHF